MEREHFAKIMQEVLDSLPEEFRSRSTEGLRFQG
jgi:predicted Zn-dependent protease with MMP-like domain